MAAPTYIASYTTVYNSNATPKTTSVTTQAGDIVVVYGGQENAASALPTPTGNSISFTLQATEGSFIGDAGASVWTGTDATGGTNWTLSCSGPGTRMWGMTCLVFRNSDGIGAADESIGNTPALPSGLTTTATNSAVVVFCADWNAIDGASRVWRTVNSVTPTSGNGLERTYDYTSTRYTVYGAYYDDVGSIGAKDVGLSAPGGQHVSVVAVEVLGSTPPPPALTALPWYSA